ncbi:hypothetical protein BD410DRAFT_530465 [Rickenella mellea]|uniref:Uncharacterized protein n=1 Tax=Rickenella mellea TaxID=50990 RepID=A0A4Y7QG72_9AGAM|nr:hypothetical protein BD410DRAFT_530465 [Rickenella mellea]
MLTHSDQIESFGRYFKALGPMMQHLRISCTKYDCSGEIRATACKEMSLAHNPCLRTITFEDLCMAPNPNILFDCAWIIGMLSRITSPFIKMVTLVIYADHLQQISSLNLPALAAFLSGGSGLPAMQSTTLSFGVLGDIDRTVAIAAITESLHDMSKQNRLAFGGHSFKEREWSDDKDIC